VTDDRPDFHAPITFEYAYTRWHDYVLRICRAYVHDPDTAADLTADTFVRAWLVWERVQPNAGFYRYLKQTALNVCHDHYRRQQQARHWAHGPILAYDPVWDDRHTADTAETPILARDLLRVVAATCTPDQQAALHLTARGWSQAEIGEALGRSPGAVKALVHRARVQVRQAVAG
jgi:RNA polymerase sigma factor (sigma-70 family)